MTTARFSPPATTRRRSSAIACRRAQAKLAWTVPKRIITTTPTMDREMNMAMKLNRRSVLQAATGAAALPLFGLGSRIALGADGEIVVRIEKDITNLDPPNRVGSVEDNIITSVCQGLARFKPGTTLEWEP